MKLPKIPLILNMKPKKPKRKKEQSSASKKHPVYITYLCSHRISILGKYALCDHIIRKKGRLSQKLALSAFLLKHKRAKGKEPVFKCPVKMNQIGGLFYLPLFYYSILLLYYITSLNSLMYVSS